MLGPQTSPCQTRFFSVFSFFSVFWLNTKGQYWKVFFPKNVRSNRKPKKPKKTEKTEKTYVSDRMLGPQTSPCQTRFFSVFSVFSVFWLNTKGQYWKVFFPKNVRSNRKPKKPKKPMSQIECWVPRHLPVRLGFFVFLFFFFFWFCFFCLVHFGGLI